MKHIFRKLHIGGSSHDPSRTGEASSSTVSPPAAPPAASCGSDHRQVLANPTPPPPPQASSEAVAEAADYFFTEEEFQMQLAMAISASNSEFRDDPHNDQIRAATLLSLGRHREDSAREDDGAAGSLARRYWDYNVLDYDDKVVDGFYDIFKPSSDSSHPGKMPSLADLQSSIGDLGFEVIIVNRTIDRSLLELEQVAQCISLDCPPGSTGVLVERIAELVTDNMGGPVRDAHDMLAKWMERSTALRTSVQTSLMPIGGVNIGLSRHRALLFKVLADKVGIPCKLVKGSHYTGIDGDALNIIKLDNGREYLVDLMAAPGTLIPADVLSVKENFHAPQNTQTTLTPTSSCSSDANLASVDSPSPKMGKSKGEHAGFKSGSSPSSFSSSSNVENESFFPDGQSSQLMARHLRTFEEKEVLGSPMKTEKNKLQSDSNLLDSMESKELFAELNPFQAIGVGKTASNSKQAGKKGNGFQRRRENISPGHNRAPLPLVWKNRSAYNEISGNKHNEMADSGFPRKNVKAKDHNPFSSSFASSPASHGNFYSGSSGVDASQSSGLPYLSHPVDIPSNGMTDILTGDFVGCTSGKAEANLSSQIGQFGPSTSTSDAIQAEHPVLLNSFENEPSDADKGKNMLLTNTSNEPEQAEHAKDKRDNKRGILIGTDRSMHSIAPALARAEKLDPALDDVAGFEIPWEDLVIGERIGLGSYGEVYHADWNGTEVAVKKFLDQDFYGDAMDEFLSEVRIMRRLRHPNVVLFMGAVVRHPNLSIVTEFLPRGSLYRILHRPNCQIDQKRRIKMALDVSKGMNYLHTSATTIVHRDLKSPNLLVDKNWNVKVCDFGLSRLKHNTFLSSKSHAGTPEWMAPEVLRNEQSNEKCDVYSFGVILWELATLRMPWSGMNPMQVVGAVGFQNRRLDIPKEVDPMVARIIRECWQQDPNLRPSFAQLTVLLKQLQQLVVEPQPDSQSPFVAQEIPVNSTP